MNNTFNFDQALKTKKRETKTMTPTVNFLKIETRIAFRLGVFKKLLFFELKSIVTGIFLRINNARQK